MHRAEEDYIKTIYEQTIQIKKDIVKTNVIAEAFGFTDQSVNEMVKKLVSKKLVKFIPYKGVHLTKKGISEAIRLLRAHRIWEVFLTKKLGYHWEDVDADAEKLEHASSVDLINRLEVLLDYPKYCQHGNPIPNMNGDIPEFSLITIDQLNEGDQFVIKRVIDQKDLLLYLNENAIELEKKYHVIKKDDFNGMIKIVDDSHEIFFSYDIAKMIFIGKI